MPISQMALRMLKLFIAVIAYWTFCDASPMPGDQTPLAEYVWRDMPGDKFAYKLMDTYRKPGATLYILRMRSLKWDNGGTTNLNTWKHWVTVAIPDNVRYHDAAMVRIEGGERKDRIPTASTYNNPVTERLLKFAIDTGAVAAEVTNIPYYPVTFFDEYEEANSDHLMAKSFSLYVDGHYDNTDYYVGSPMIRAARRGVDTVIEFAASVNSQLNITRVMTSGRAKRGLVAWLLAGIDSRVVAVHPEAFTQTNYKPFINDLWQSLGAWPWAFSDYSQQLTGPNTLHTARGNYIFEQYSFDPYTYFEHMANKPIMLVVSTGDEFFFPDTTWNFWSDIAATKYLTLIENNSHRLRGRYDSIWKNMANFFLFTFQGNSGPAVSWTRTEGDGGVKELTVTVDQLPYSASTWCANSNVDNVGIDANGTEIPRRDFREYTLTPTFQFEKGDIVWTEGPLQESQSAEGSWTYTTSASPPAEGGYRACFIQMRFEGPERDNWNHDEFLVTSELIVAPNARPFPPCGSYDECIGTLV